MCVYIKMKKCNNFFFFPPFLFFFSFPFLFFFASSFHSRIFFLDFFLVFFSLLKNEGKILVVLSLSIGIT